MIHVQCTRAVLGDPMGAVAAKILESELAKRSTGAVPTMDILLDLHAGAGDGFEIAGPPEGPIRIIGDKPAALFPGIGKFLRTSRWTRAGFEPSMWRGVSHPERDVRGIYFATHFHNFYHEAPIEEVERYVEQLALWGCNALSVWFDMAHFRSIDDPKARAMIARLHAILRAANRVGIGASMGFPVNEAYNSSPVELRADYSIGHDGYHTEPCAHYHLEICPSKPGGLDYLRRIRREMLEAFADLDVRWMGTGPWDSGGCTCHECAPWGVNGYLRTARELVPIVQEIMPSAEIILGTWYLDHFIAGEWDGFAREMRTNRPEWLRYILADDYGDKYPAHILEHGVPGGAKLLNFPEISMYRSFPWGGYGANPLPAHIQKIWDTIGSKLSGGTPYSEGLYEDINKAVCLQHYWCGQDATQTVREYAAQYFGADSADAVGDIVAGMESRHGLQVALPWGAPASAIDSPADSPDAAVVFGGPDLAGAGECLEKMRAVEQAMPDAARADWRWRVLMLRAGIEAEIQRTGGKMTDALDAMFRELVTIYHADRGAYAHVSPPSRKMLRHYWVEGNKFEL